MHSAKWEILPNGLRVLTLEFPHLNSLRFDLFLRDGSRWETQQTSGLAHLTEHMLFNGTAAYPTAVQLALAAADIGGAMNGEVGQELTNYSLWTRPRYLEQGMAIFASMLTEPIFDPDELEVEKKIVLAEIAEQPGTSTLDELLWPGHPLSFPVPGKRRRVAAFRREDVVWHYRSFYRPDNMVLVVAGPVCHADVTRLAARHFGGMNGRFDRVFEPAPPPNRRPVARFNVLRDVQTYAIALAYPMFPRTPAERAAFWLLNTVLGTSDTARLFLRVREELGLVYSIDSHTALWSDAGVLEIECKAARPKLRRALRQVLKEVDELRRRPIEPDELKRAKEWRIASLESLLDDPEGLARRYAAGALFEDPLPLETLIDLTAAVTAEDLLAAARQAFGTTGPCLLIQGPELTPAARAALRADFVKMSD